GIQDIFSINMTYNYVLPSYIGLFSFGIGSGILNISNNGNDIVTPKGIYQNENSDHNDEFLDNLLLDDRSFYNFSVFGLYNYNNFEVGIVFDKKLALGKNDLSYDYHDLFKVNWQYVYSINKDIYLKIFGLIQSDFILLQTNIGFTADYRSILAGLNVRGYSPDTFNSISIILGGNINSKLRIIYAYDVSLSTLRSVEDGTHEFKITYDFGNLKNNIKLPAVIFNPRL
ncbi:MAG TPA: type IX secretion system membrane protein PorP/SprF, partial [Bacteroidetes bacterium]|nr:type IX secretion system membrane protein PorP/SprF [Bacteroidota bacterium]